MQRTGLPGVVDNEFCSTGAVVVPVACHLN